MGQTVQYKCSLTELKHIKDRGKCLGEFKTYYKTLLPENLGTLCCAWTARRTNVETQMAIAACSKPHDIMIFTAQSLEIKSGSGLISKQATRTVDKDSGAHRVITSSLTMEVEAVTHSSVAGLPKWHKITCAIILTDLMNLLQKVKSGMGCTDWHAARHSLPLC